MWALPAAEWAAWAAHYRRHGFPGDRQEWATAIGAEYVGAVWGGKARARELIPRFGPAPQQPLAVVMAWFDSLVPPNPESNGG